jgi:hypothetical protein
VSKIASHGPANASGLLLSRCGPAQVGGEGAGGTEVRASRSHSRDTMVKMSNNFRSSPWRKPSGLLLQPSRRSPR